MVALRKWNPTTKRLLADTALDRARRALHRYAMARGEEAVERIGCVFHAVAVALELAGQGERPVIQAGTFNWPIVPEGEDDGVSPTHYSYEWSPGDARSAEALAKGGMPEMHVWVGLPDLDGGTLVDNTTRYLPQNVRAAGLELRTAEPPECLWATADTLPARVRYLCVPQAVLLALRFGDVARGFMER